MTAPAPRVHLPSQAALNPNLSPLLTIPSRALAECGPLVAARHCKETAAGLLQVSYEDEGVIVVGDDEMPVSRSDMRAAAFWFLECAVAMERACQ